MRWGTQAADAERHARSRVAVAVTSTPVEVRIEVADDGPGIPARQRSAVFERFRRVDDARARDDGGSGLGLAIVRDIVSAHGGSVEVADAGGGGALLVVKLRRWAPAAVPSASEHLSSDTAS